MVSPGLPPPREQNASVGGDLARRVTPLTGAGIVAVYGLAAVALGALWHGGLAPGAAAALLVALAGVVGTIYFLARRAEGMAAAAAQSAAEGGRREALLRLEVEGTGVGLGLIDSAGTWVAANESLTSILGMSASDLRAKTLASVTEPGWVSDLEQALGDVQGGAAGRWQGESVQVRANGESYPFAMTISAVPANGSGPLFLVEETDVSSAKRADKIREALAAVRHTVATSASWEQAAPAVLTALGTTLGFDAAQFWTLDDQDAFRLGHAWHRDIDRLIEFERDCRGLAIPAGEGVFGRARQSGVPALDRSITPQGNPGLVVAGRKAALRSIAAAPVAATGDVRAVIALFSEEAGEHGDDVTTMLAAAGSEIGQFIQRADNTAVLQRSEADHRAIFERAPMGIARISSEGALVEANAALLAMLGFDFPTLRDQAWPDLLRSYDQAAQRARVAPLLAGISAGDSVQVRAATGAARWLWLQMTATSIPDELGRPEHVLVMVEDVTKVRDAQDKVTEALEAQKSANADLEKLDRTKTEFLSIVSHEFRTALTGIQGFSELIRDGGLEADELRAYGGYIFNDAERVNRLIGDMLDLDRMESGRMIFRMADVDINEVLSDAIARASTSSNVEFKPDLDPRLPIVTGDRDRLVQVVSNLVNNAVKYSPEGGVVTLTSRSDGGYALVTVADTGLGIPPDEIPHVFERFRRVRSGAAQSIAGTGLGLTIVKQIVEMHGGKLWVESAVGHGSAFHFTIPLAVEAVTPSMQLRHA
jgi:PAS domain S-box-containing protein